MQNIQELIKINEAAEAEKQPKDLKDLIEFFPKGAQKAISAVSDRLTYNDQLILDTIIGKLNRAAEADLRDEEMEVDIDMTADLIDKKTGEPTEVQVHTLDVELGDSEEVYLGYSPSKDTFVMGFDCWMNEESLWEVLEKFVKREGADTNDETYDAFTEKVWKSLQGARAFAVVEMKYDGSTTVKSRTIRNGGFYKKGHKFVKSEYSDILDIRLD